MSKINLQILLGAMFLLQISCMSQEARNSTSSNSLMRKPADVELNSQILIKVANEERRFSREDLLGSSSLKKLVIEKDPAYPGRRMTYFAVPLASLFEGLKVDSSGTLLFSCLDGFSAPISATRLLNKDPNQAIAYIAIESPNERWPQLKANHANTAGPFYLVWENPEKSKVGNEEWPFQLAGFELKPGIESQFPLTVPAEAVPMDSPIREGYKLFTKNCFACHTVNGQGASQVGPDLNIPHNPTEYMKPNFLVKLIRDPQSLRHWPQAKMNGFDRSTLSDGDLRNIVLYLQHMATQKN